MPFLYEVEFVYPGSGAYHLLELVTEHKAKTTNTSNDYWQIPGNWSGPPFISSGGNLIYYPYPSRKILLYDGSTNVMYELTQFVLGVAGNGGGTHVCPCAVYPLAPFNWIVRSIQQIP